MYVKCESLWMGVPVITLKGSHYVSRMSMAVLAGAQLDDWIADSEDNYLAKAIEAAQQLTFYSNRFEWRQQSAFSMVILRVDARLGGCSLLWRATRHSLYKGFKARLSRCATNGPYFIRKRSLLLQVLSKESFAT